MPRLENIDSKTLKQFLSSNGEEQFVESKVNYGLIDKYGDILLSMSMGTPTRDDGIVYEISNICFSNKLEVDEKINSLNKAFTLLTESKRPPMSIVCYSDRVDESILKQLENSFDKFKYDGVFEQKHRRYYRGIWDDQIREIDVEILKHVSLNQIFDFKFNSNNSEEILNSIGFKLIEEGKSYYKKYTWFRGGCVYKMIAPDGKFYIGSTTNDLSKYTGSGPLWKKHLKDNNFKEEDVIKEVIKDDFNSEQEMRDFESEEISKYLTNDNGFIEVKDENCLNMVKRVSNSGRTRICPECGGAHNVHKKGCSKYKLDKYVCDECGAVGGTHKKTCSKAKLCPECGSFPGHHKKTCSKYKDQGVCPYCGYQIRSRRHAKDCPMYRDFLRCDECGSPLISHTHKPWCSHYKDPGTCPECGYTLQSRRHAPTCSHYKETKRCPECGSKTLHKPTCSHYKERAACPHCGSKTSHKKDCPRYKAPIKCPICGSSSRHKKDCPNAKKPLPPCEVCGGKDGKHLKSCKFHK